MRAESVLGHEGVGDLLGERLREAALLIYFCQLYLLGSGGIPQSAALALEIGGLGVSLGCD
jgi:hypothetical protein